MLVWTIGQLFIGFNTLVMSDLSYNSNFGKNEMLLWLQTLELTFSRSQICALLTTSTTVHKNTRKFLSDFATGGTKTTLTLQNSECLEPPSFAGNEHLSLYKSNKGLNELDERLLTFMACLRAWCGWFGLGGGEDATSWR